YPKGKTISRSYQFVSVMHMHLFQKTESMLLTDGDGVAA
ncbi:MAG: hypothetical protein ACJAUZ_003277, partial [Flavobacteriaceae bacterium]